MREFRKVAALSILLLFFLSAVALLYYSGYPSANPEDLDSSELHSCFQASLIAEVNWRAVWSECRVKGLDVKAYAGEVAARQAASSLKDKEYLSAEFNGIDSFKAMREYNALKDIDRMLDYTFPIDSKNYGYAYTNSWGAKRSFGGDRLHEGTDIICKKGTPILSVCNGSVEKLGWNTLGGWRVGIRGEDGLYYYYAHLSGFNVKKGQKVKMGEVIGYAGDSGYGNIGQTGKFPSHLHFGIYHRNKSFNPYPFLAVWEKRIE